MRSDNPMLTDPNEEPGRYHATNADGALDHADTRHGWDTWHFPEIAGPAERAADERLILARISL